MKQSLVFHLKLVQFTLWSGYTIRRDLYVVTTSESQDTSQTYPFKSLDCFYGNNMQRLKGDNCMLLAHRP